MALCNQIANEIQFKSFRKISNTLKGEESNLDSFVLTKKKIITTEKIDRNEQMRVCLLENFW